ncbi:hypothetical protein K461DRAFT_284647 [Myriangium duriaei CBS 260.36]|uniref:AB hydrolase-1 domain-containing protein n=1 Tax=Myriangium duriaei CBS 260.36 TaxID=1168546 RepID=A0A9P4MK53_9PEZI|nr:hypothetical protein K461DRAFT_284647 [Myriangium duriaei CBS 260.36]
MVSLWGSKKNDDAESERPASADDNQGSNQGSSRAPPSRDEHHDTDERAPLLPRERRRQPHADGYLDPDDPAVSPYNLWKVRLTRHFTVLFLTITFVWWVLLLVSIFVSPPGLQTRGSGFFDFSYTTLTAGNLLVTLLFFTAPSKAMRILLGVLTLFLLVDMLIIVIVGRLRAEESWPGILSVVWAVAVSAWCLITDRIVASGKREEEERLTGRPETRRTVREWLAVLVATIILAFYVVIVVFMTATLILRSRDASLQAPGERIFVDGGKYEVHVACVGNTTDELGTKYPTVLLEAGESTVEWELVPWATNALKNGTIKRFCYWDRPGYGWSDNAPSPHSAGMSADALSEALAVQGEHGPWVLVSTGYGTIVSRIFSSRHNKAIAGLLLIDPLHEDLLYRLSQPGRGFLLWAWGIISPLGIQRVLGALFAGRTREDRVYGKYAYQGGKFIKAQLQENLIADSLTKNEVTTARTVQSGDVPYVLVSSGISNARDRDWERKQRDLTKLTDNLISWDVVEKAPHQVWRTFHGRQVLEKRLAQLVNTKKRVL